MNFDYLKKMGIVLKRARYFITCDGKTVKPEKDQLSDINDKLKLDSPDKKQRDELLLFS